MFVFNYMMDMIKLKHVFNILSELISLILTKDIAILIQEDLSMHYKIISLGYLEL